MCRIGGPGSGRRRSRRDRRLNFSERVKLVSVKNAGLHVAQKFVSGNFGPGLAAQMIMSWASVIPLDYNDMGVMSSGNASKVFVEKVVDTLRYFNNSNVPIFVRLVYAVVRRDIPFASYSDYITLLQDGAPMQVNLGHGNPLTSNAAQRYLRWIRTDNHVFNPGDVFSVVLENYCRRMMSGDIEGNTSFLSTRGSLVLLPFFDGIPISDSLNSGLISTGPISFQETDAMEVHWRDVEDNAPTSVVSIAFPSVSGFGNVVEPKVDVDQPVLQ